MRRPFARDIACGRPGPPATLKPTPHPDGTSSAGSCRGALTWGSCHLSGPALRAATLLSAAPGIDEAHAEAIGDVGQAGFGRLHA
ncbi:MAG: hypothetical protein ACKOFW_18105, partial [Planctomycetaceae bacterium]